MDAYEVRTLQMECIIPVFVNTSVIFFRICYAQMYGTFYKTVVTLLIQRFEIFVV